MIVCSGPNCQTTAGCQCRRRSDMTAHWPPILGPSRSDVDRAFAAGRLAGLREAAEAIETHAKDMMAYRDHHYVAKHLRSAKDAILTLASGKE